MLNLHHSPPISAIARRLKRLERCRTRGSLKRKSPSNQELLPSSKKIAPINRNLFITGYQDLVNPSNLNAMNQASSSSLLGNFKNTDNFPGGSLISPIENPIPMIPQPLFKSLSDPVSLNNQPVEIKTPPKGPPFFQPRNSDQDLVNSTTFNSMNQVSTVATSISQLSNPLLRYFSDPISSNYQPVEITTPSKAPALLLPRISDQETPTSKKLKGKMEEMMQWMGDIMLEEDEDITQLQINDKNNSKECENQESVLVEKTEEGLMLHFNCPCGSGYEIFLRGDKCYYRLI